jgi:hypothetical protein
MGNRAGGSGGGAAGNGAGSGRRRPPRDYSDDSDSEVRLTNIQCTATPIPQHDCECVVLG